MTAPGTRYQNTSGMELYGFFPPDAVVEVRDDGHDQDMVTLEYFDDEDPHIGRAVAVDLRELATHFEQVD